MVVTISGIGLVEADLICCSLLAQSYLTAAMRTGLTVNIELSKTTGVIEGYTLHA